MKASLAKEVNRIAGLIFLAALAALAVGHIWPLLAGLVGYIFWSTRQLFALYSWLVRDDHTEPPDSIGLWGEFYTRLEHLFQKERRAQSRLNASNGQFRIDYSAAMVTQDASSEIGQMLGETPRETTVPPAPTTRPSAAEALRDGQG